jgi:hypothetical protein
MLALLVAMVAVAGLKLADEGKVRLCWRCSST